MNKATATNEDNDILEIFNSLRITKNKHDRLFGGRWVNGMIGGHKFEALIFPASAGRGWICQLTVEQIKGRRTVASYCLGWDRRPATRKTRIIVDALVKGLTEASF